ncbi:Methyltransferase domain-containing protein [Marininema mesophilum]|uniref:Methyltransferase domain-containing protein n=1 Tax=Marininema mesophilum TaxID=1048340 RepID=A0A1H2VFP5_9BACL|nr:class I SAM-dependent methyltransferase [Marininema mesophilum]SDW66709.1 Methyltransferase domain-containing protein [Marininema mesophilum]
MEENKQAVQKQFTQTGTSYRKSTIHASGSDLTWISELAGSPMLALDVATGAGHTAFTLSSIANRVVGMDLTERMLQIAEEGARQRKLTNITWFQGDAEAIPFPDKLFDLVTCRIAAHHFPHPERAFFEFRRVLVPGGKCIFIDNYAPSEPGANLLINEVERLRDPSHFYAWTKNEWQEYIAAGGLTSISLQHEWTNTVELEDWFRRADTPLASRSEVRRLLSTSSPTLQRLFDFDLVSPAPYLLLHKGLWTAQRPL